METPRYNTENLQENYPSKITQLEEEQIIAGLYQDIDLDSDDRFSGSLAPKQFTLPHKPNKTKTFHFSIPIHHQRFIDEKSPAGQYFTVIKTEPGPAGLSSSTKCGMDSPSFCKGDSDAFNTVFPAITAEGAHIDNQQLMRQGLLSDSEIKSPPAQESVRGMFADSIKTANFKMSGISEEQQSKRDQISLSLNKSNSLSGGPSVALNLCGQKSDRDNSNRSNECEMKESGYSRIPRLFNKERAAGMLNNDFERPGSSPDLDRSGTTGDLVQTSRTVGVEMSQLEIADPLSLGNFDEKFQRRNKPVSNQVSSRGNLKERKAQAAGAQGGQLMKSSNSTNNLKQMKGKKEEKTPENNRNTVYKKVLSQNKRPKEIEIVIGSLNEYQLKPEHKLTPSMQSKNVVASTKQSSKAMVTPNTTKPNSDHALKTWKVGNGTSSPKKNAPSVTTSFVKDLQWPPAQNGSSSPKKGAAGKLGTSKEVMKLSPSNKSSPKFTEGSPKAKPQHQSKKSLTSMNLKATVPESPARKSKQSENAKVRDKSNEVRKKLQKSTNTREDITLDRSVEEATPTQKSASNVNLYTDSEQTTMQETSKLEVMEANLREIQGKNLLRGGTPKHVRYPSFGSGLAVEKERRGSSRRTISQDAQCVQALQQFIHNVDREKGFKDFSTGGNLLSKPDILTKSMPKLQAPANRIEESKETQSPPKKQQTENNRLSYSSLMQSLNLRKNLVAAQEETPLSSRSHKAHVNTSIDTNSVDLATPSIGSGTTISSKTTNKFVVDIYQRNSQWLNLKQGKIQNIGLIQKKEEMKECTFKPHRNIGFKTESEYAQKNFNNYGIGKLKSEVSESPEKRSVSKEKKSLNSYNGIYNLKKEVMTPKPGAPKSPKSNFYGRREVVEAMVLRTNPH